MQLSVQVKPVMEGLLKKVNENLLNRWIIQNNSNIYFSSGYNTFDKTKLSFSLNSTD